MPFTFALKHMHENLITFNAIFLTRKTIFIGEKTVTVFLMLAMAIERYILIARGTEAKVIFSPKRRKTLYVITVATCIAFSTLHLLDFGANFAMKNEYEWERNVHPMTEKVTYFQTKKIYLKRLIQSSLVVQNM